MQDKHHLDNDFDIINSLYLDYLKALNQSNNEVLLLQLKEKIVVAFWKTLQKASSITSEMIEHTDVMIQKIYYCMDECAKYENQLCFSKYTFTSIKKALGTKVDTEQFEIKSGMHISDSENRKRKKIENAYKQYKSFNSNDLNAFIKYATNHLGFEKTEVEEYLFPKHSVSLFAQSQNDDEYCIADKYVDTTKVIDNAEVIGSTELLENHFNSIDSLWLKQKEDARPLLSELLTRELLAEFKENSVLSSFIPILNKPKFICKEMVESFFSDLDYQLPAQQDIGQKYGITKSAASVKLKRFIEKLKER